MVCTNATGLPVALLLRWVPSLRFRNETWPRQDWMSLAAALQLQQWMQQHIVHASKRAASGHGGSQCNAQGHGISVLVAKAMAKLC